ncbi:60S acidic ribosomal protein P0 [Tanacetum coccineum]
MAVKLTKMQKKTNYDAKLSKLLDHYTQILIVGADNVGSNQLQHIRQGLRGDSIVLMGKNTMMKRTIRLHAEKTGNKDILNLIPLLVGNVGLVFTKGDLKEVSEVVAKYKHAEDHSYGQTLLRMILDSKNYRRDVALMVDGCFLPGPSTTSKSFLPENSSLTKSILRGTSSRSKSFSADLAKNLGMAECSHSPARVGLIAPIDVVVPPGNTGLDPSQTSFFQVLNIPTKINKGTVEIITPVDLIQKGDKVGSSEAALLTKLGRKPFSYGLIVQFVYENGSVFTPEVLDLTEDDLAEKFANGVSQVAAFSLAINYPSLAAAPHMIINGYKNLLSVAVTTEYSFQRAEKVIEYLKDPSKFAAMAQVASSAAANSSGAPAAAEKEQKKEEPQESSEDEGVSRHAVVGNVLKFKAKDPSKFAAMAQVASSAAYGKSSEHQHCRKRRAEECGNRKNPSED